MFEHKAYKSHGHCSVGVPWGFICKLRWTCWWWPMMWGPKQARLWCSNASCRWLSIPCNDIPSSVWSIGARIHTVHVSLGTESKSINQGLDQIRKSLSKMRCESFQGWLKRTLNQKLGLCCAIGSMHAPVSLWNIGVDHGIPLCWRSIYIQCLKYIV